MTAKDLLRTRNQRPFQPIRVMLSNGISYEVRHPEFFIIGRDSSHIGIPTSEEDGQIVDHLIRISNDHIVAIQPLESSETVKA